MNQYRAAICTALTGPDAIEIITQPRKPLEAGQIRVAVAAAGLNFPDLLMTRGEYQLRLEPPFIPGMECAGTVIETGPGVTQFGPGDAIMGGARGGAIAEEIVIKADDAALVPSALSLDEAACYRAGAITALHALVDKGQIQAGQTVLILGAAGGVGMAAVQLAQHLGAIVIGTGSTAEKRATIIANGAAHALDPLAADLVDHVKSLTSGRGIDLVFDPVGGDLALKATRMLAWGGRYLIVGFASGTIPSFPANHALIKGYSLIGLRAGESGRRDPALAARNRALLAEFAAQGIMKPHISHRFALDECSAALKALEQRIVIGRAIVQPRISQQGSPQ